MKKFFALLAALLLLASCGRQDAAGNLVDQEYVGKFHGFTIYKVLTPGGTLLFIGIKDDGKVASIRSGVKVPVNFIGEN